jgi:DNA-binding LacI/PurR family transcriptional regulator
LKLSDENIFFAPNGRPEGGEIGAQYFLNLPHPPTAIMCFNDMLAIGVLKALRVAGWEVPMQCSVMGYDDIPLAAYTYPPLTTFQQPKYQLGYQAAQMMYNQLQPEADANAVQVKTVQLRGTMIVRASTAPCSFVTD